MVGYHDHADPPRTLVDRLRQLNDNLQALGERLKHSIASVIGTTIAEAVRDAVRRLLGLGEPVAPLPRDHNEFHDPWNDNEDRRWGQDRQEAYWREDEGSHWREDDELFSPAGDMPAPSKDTSQRWRAAWTSGLRAALWWLRMQPCHRPVLTATLVALASGGAALLAGPTLVACVSVVASVTHLVLTADAARSAGTLIGQGIG